MTHEIEMFEISEHMKNKNNRIENVNVQELKLNKEQNEYFDTPERSKGKFFYSEAINDIHETFEDYIPKERMIQLNEVESLDRIKLYSLFQYKHEFPELPDKVLAHYDSKTDIIYIKESDDNNILKHSTTHETFHRSSFNGVREVQNLDKVEFVNCSGVRETSQSINRNRGLNEGLTEMLTIQSLKRRNEKESITSINAYSDLVRITTELTDIVGIDTISRAYFKGEIKVLENKINLLTNRKDGFNTMNLWMDYIVINPYSIESSIAKKELTRMFLEIRRNK